MHVVKPTVRLIASTAVRHDAIGNALTDFGADDFVTEFLTRNTSQAEQLVEYAGRRCYRSWEPGLNANVTKTRTDPREYLNNILRSGHGSVLEHASFTFDFHNVSRVATHELVRHRAGTAMSQESLRYVRLTDIGFRMTEDLEPYADSVVSIVEQIETLIGEASDRLDEQGVPFSEKKRVTSALRRIAPMGTLTGIVWTANLRTLRHVVELRTAPGAEEEIRDIFGQVASIMVTECPTLFGDFACDEHGVWAPEHSKI